MALRPFGDDVGHEHAVVTSCGPARCSDGRPTWSGTPASRSRSCSASATSAGNFAAAADHAGEAATLAALTGSRSQYAWAVAQQAYVDAHVGDVASARARATEARTLLSSSGYLQPGVWASATTTHLELSLGNLPEAVDASEPLVQVIEGLDSWEPIIAFFLPDALEAMIGVGQLNRAELLVDQFQRRGRELGRSWAIAPSANLEIRLRG